MTAIRGYVPPAGNRLGVHSLDHFVLAVPDLAVAAKFYGSFGLDVREDGNALALRTFGHDQRWGTVVEDARKRLHHVSFGCYADDLPRLKARAEANGAEILDPPTGFASNGFWLRDPAGVLVEVKVAAKVSPDRKMSGIWSSSPEGVAGAPVRGDAPIVRPRRLSHMLVFTTDVGRAVDFYSRNLGLRLSDRSDVVAFMHAVHGSDHHILAFAQSPGPGIHHSQLGRRRDRRHRARRHAHGRPRLHPRLGPRPPRARLELLPLRAGPLGQLRRIFLRHRLHPGDPGLAGRRAPPGGFVLPLGPAATGGFHHQPRG